MMPREKTFLEMTQESDCILRVSLYPSMYVRMCVPRPAGAVLQSDLVPQPHPGTDLHTCDWLGQRPLHPPLGQEETLRPGPLRGDAAGSGHVVKWLFNR